MFWQLSDQFVDKVDEKNEIICFEPQSKNKIHKKN